MGLHCEVCKEAQHKYKCPSCFVPYCSVVCFKKHKEIPCKKSSPPVEELSTNVVPDKSIISEDKPGQLFSLYHGQEYDTTRNGRDTIFSVSVYVVYNTVFKKKNIDTNTASIVESTTMRPERSLQVDDPNCVLSNKQLLSIVESNEIRGFLEDGELREMVQMIDSSKEPDIELDLVMRGEAFSKFSDKILSILNPQERAL